MDEISKETLIGANIYDQQNKQGTITNPFGFFSITLPEGNTELNFSYIGYGSKQIALYLCKDTLLTVQLKNDNTLEEIVVLSDKMETGFQSSRMGANNIPLTHIKNTPALLSEADVLKSIQLLPGIQGGITGTSGLYVRGGSPDQNLYLLDGVPLYNVDHTLGILSIFHPESVKKVDLYKAVSCPLRRKTVQRSRYPYKGWQHERISRKRHAGTDLRQPESGRSVGRGGWPCAFHG